MNEKEKFDRLCYQVSEIHTTIFGAQGQGGLIRDHENTKKDVRRLKEFHYKLVGGLIVVSALFSFIWKLLMP